MFPFVPDIVPNILQALVVVVAFSLAVGPALRKWAWLAYTVAVLAGILTFVPQVVDIPAMGVALDVLASCYTGVAIYLVVMFAGALPRPWKLTKRLLSIRSELSILGGIIIAFHVVKVILFVPMSLTPMWILIWKRAFIWMFVASTLVGVPLLVCFAIPWVTSFPAVRRGMTHAEWKKKQRLAYPFMALLIVQGILLSCGHAAYVGSADAGYAGYVVNAVTYAAIGALYLVLKLVETRRRRALKDEARKRMGMCKEEGQAGEQGGEKTSTLASESAVEKIPEQANNPDGTQAPGQAVGRAAAQA